jgi:hypothetical protein
VRVHNIQIGQTIERTLTSPIQQSDLIRAALTRLNIGQHSQRVKNLTPHPYARGGGASTRGDKAKGRRQKVKMLIVLLNFLAGISRVIPVSKKKCNFRQVPNPDSHQSCPISNLKSQISNAISCQTILKYQETQV